MVAFDVVDSCGHRFSGACKVEVPPNQSGSDAITNAESYRLPAPASCSAQDADLETGDSLWIETEHGTRVHDLR